MLIVAVQVLAYMFAQSVLFGMHAIFTSLRRADCLSSPPNSTFFYAVRVSCAISDFSPALIPAVEVEVAEVVQILALTLVSCNVSRKHWLFRWI